jgi:hypothetical protein
MRWVRPVGVAMVVIGGMILLFGLNEADSFSEQWGKFFTGHFSDGTMGYLAGGLVTLVIGCSMVLYGGGRRAA